MAATSLPRGLSAAGLFYETKKRLDSYPVHLIKFRLIYDISPIKNKPNFMMTNFLLLPVSVSVGVFGV